ncbi:MAG: hypothetical protein JKY69_06540 [Flavobacteriaceae bacterium]|nr:hypothetical protein [Flavobacteriaceae bacterium]
MKKFFTLLLLAVTLVSTAQETTLLRLNYTKGDSYTMSMNMVQNVDGAPVMTMSMDMTIDIIDVTGDEYTSEMKFAKMKMDMFGGGMNVSFDSTKSDDELDAIGKMMKAQMGPMLKIVISTKGNNLGDILEMKIEPNIPGAADMANQKNNVVYPKHAVKVGDSWDIEREEKGMKMNFIYTVKSIEKKTVDLSVSGKISGLADGTISGTMNIERATGIPLKTVLNMDMTIQEQQMNSKIVAVMTKK